MLEYKLQAKLRGYIEGVFPTKVSELENDIPFIAAVPQQNLTSLQKKHTLKNLDAVNILSSNFIRYDINTDLSELNKKTARDNIEAASCTELLKETKDRIEMDEALNNAMVKRMTLNGQVVNSEENSLIVQIETIDGGNI